MPPPPCLRAAKPLLAASSFYLLRPPCLSLGSFLLGGRTLGGRTSLFEAFNSVTFLGEYLMSGLLISLSFSLFPWTSLAPLLDLWFWETGPTPWVEGDAGLGNQNPKSVAVSSYLCHSEGQSVWELSQHHQRKTELRDKKRLISDEHLDPTTPESNTLRTFLIMCQ